MLSTKLRSTVATAVWLAAVLHAGNGYAAEAQPAQSESSSPPAQDEQTVTIFAKKRSTSERARTQISTSSAASCGFMNAYDSANDDITRGYMQDVGADPDSNVAPDADPNDPNTPGATFRDTSPLGPSAAQDSNVSESQMTGGDSTSASPGACDASDKAFAAGRNFIARNDHSLKDAFAAFDDRDYPKAFTLFKASYSKLGYDEAALMIGKMYLIGQGVGRDPKAAIIWLRKVADAPAKPGQQGFDPADPESATPRSDATMLLGKIYLAGMGVAKDAKAARAWYLKADGNGYIPGTYTVGQAYEYGYGGEKSFAKAVTYFKKAGTVGYAPAQYELGVIYYNGADGVPQDQNTAAAWLVLAAKQGNASALYACGRMYDLGQGGVAPDPQKAILYYKEAALKGQPDAEYALGMSFYTGDTVAKDLVTARKFFQASAEQGTADAMFNLAVMLTNGEGGAKDLGLAYAWFSLASKRGLDKADAAVAELAGKLSPADRATADAVLNVQNAK